MMGIQTRPHMKTKKIVFKLKSPVNRLFYLGAQQQDILAQPLTNFFVVEHQESKGRQMQFQVQILPLNLILNGKK